MGQTSSHKHLRSDFVKSANLNPSSYMGTSSGSAQSGYSSTLDYTHDELIEDDEILAPSINSRNSYVKIDFNLNLNRE